MDRGGGPGACIKTLEIKNNITEEVPTSFRCPRGMLEQARERLKPSMIKLPEALRLATQSIAEGDVSIFSEALSGLSEESTATAINDGWLYRRCHELFDYQQGQLIRKSGKGKSKAGEAPVIVMRNGLPTVAVSGNNYPLKDIVWIMLHGEFFGEVLNNDGDVMNIRAENLILNPYERVIVKIDWRISKLESEALRAGKLRALLMQHRPHEMRLSSALSGLLDKGEAFHIVLSDGSGWRAVRRGIFASLIEVVGDIRRFVVSLS